MTKKIPARLRNYHIAYNEAENFSLPWVRIADFNTLTLPRPIVLINGTFDLLHSSHMRLIFAAREKATTLICAMDSDRLVKEHKGPSRPILTWPERYSYLSYMPLDYIVEIDSSKEFKALIDVLTPDLRVQGFDYANSVSRVPNTRKLFVREGALHTSEIIRRCKEA